MTHTHRWHKVYEEALLGGYFPIGWECTECGKYVEQHKIGPAGLPGETTKGAKLIGPCGSTSLCADGSS